MVFLIVLFFFTCGFCADLPSKDLLKEECIQTYRNHSFGEPVIHGTKQKIHLFEGLAGNIDAFDCKYKIKMRLDFSNKKIKGDFYYLSNKYAKIPVKGMIDSNNNIILIEVIENNWEGYKFKGIFKDGVIKGLWSKGGEKKSFAFYSMEVKGK